METTILITKKALKFFYSQGGLSELFSIVSLDELDQAEANIKSDKMEKDEVSILEVIKQERINRQEKNNTRKSIR